ncbi:DUF1932 domain-containing protein [Hasllibacter sp. MH4015]|uniref:NAD(P)-binding domain-containing protein n=1 Tax=Hasllibacter sp. MH4015 TaxID=2854029 RepID=UPI001CD2F060|nr:DUF1932 domain-containing protein [Hasllibacter sp. MH4015]
MKVAFIGFSEAGPAFADVMIRNGAEVRAFDLRSLDPETAVDQRARTARVGAKHSGSMAAAFDSAELIFSTVTASAAFAVARDAAQHLTQTQIFCDLNSVAPATKLAIRDAITPSGARFVEAVAMGRTAEGRLPPLLLAGPHAATLAPILLQLGIDAAVAGEEWGAAATVKLLRSVVVKGVEAVLSEAIEGAETIGATPALFHTLSDWAPGIDWPTFSAYHLNRVAKHGTRRGAELRECAALLKSLGVDAPTTSGAAERQSNMAGRKVVLAKNI